MGIQSQKIKPFLKWAGSKQRLCPTLIKMFPNNIDHYYETFVGAGNFLFYIDSSKYKCTISDLNSDLIATYQAIKQDVDQVIDNLRILKNNHSKDHYYHIRSLDMVTDLTQIAANFIYLNKTGFNGIYRVNSKGKYNIPFNKDSTATSIYDRDNLKKISEILQPITILNSDFNYLSEKTDLSRSFIFCDPPYHSGFTAYTKQGFNEENHIRLKNSIVTWHGLGAKILTTNYNTPFISDLYSDKIFNKIVVDKFNTEKQIKTLDKHGMQEIIITNY